MPAILIRNAKLATSADSKPIDILIESGVISRINPAGSVKSDTDVQELDVYGMLVLPGMFDLHAHLCQPGYESRERISTATAAAIQGGITGIQAMPDTNPALDSSANIELFSDICEREGSIEIIPTGCLTKGMQGEEQVSYESLRSHGVRFITDGDKRPENLLLLYRAMQYAGPLGMTFAIRGDVPMLTANSTVHPSGTSYLLGLSGAPACAEEIGTDTIIRLSHETQNALHVQVVSTGISADIIRQWKTLHPHLSSEVALHHLLFTHEDIGDFDTTFKTTPPLRTKEDTDMLIRAINDGTIDCIVSDHTPATEFEKKQDFCIAPQGLSSLDTFLPALYHHLIKTERISWETVIKACCENPRKLLNLPIPSIAEGEPANLVIFDPEGQTKVTGEYLKSRSKSNPFMGQVLNGRVCHVFFNNRYYNCEADSQN